VSNTNLNYQVLIQGQPILAGTFTVGVNYLIESVGTTNFVAIGAASNTIGVRFVATGVGSGTGYASPVALALSTVPGATFTPATGIGVGYPMVIDVPQGDGQELDPVSGTIRTSQYTVTAADTVIPSTSPALRIVTSVLFDSAGRQQLLESRAVVNISTDGGSTWSGLLYGYLVQYRLADAITWEFSIGDSRHIENTLQVFDGTDLSLSRGCIFGGPLSTQGAGKTWLNQLPIRGGWAFKVVQTSAGTLANGALVTYEFLSGYVGINDQKNSKFLDVLNCDANSLSCPVNNAVQSYYSQSPVLLSDGVTAVYGNGQGGFPGITCQVLSSSAGAVPYAFFTPANVAIGADALNMVAIVQGNKLNNGGAFTSQLTALLPFGATLPTVGDVHYICAFTSLATDVSPVYLDLHPVDLANYLYTQAGIAVNAASVTATKNALGATWAVAFRIASSVTLGDFLDSTLFGPFGFSARTNTAGERVFFTTRLKSATAPSVTIGTADLQDASGIIFDADAATLVRSVRYTSKQFQAYAPNAVVDTGPQPLDAVIETDVVTTYVYVDPNPNVPPLYVTNTTEIDYTIPGKIHDLNGNDIPMAGAGGYVNGVALELFDRFGRGAPKSDPIAVLRSSDPGVGLQVGDEIEVNPAHFPNANYRFGDNPGIAARVMQVIRRTETPAGPLIKLIDAGSLLQPATAPTVTVAQSATLPRSVAVATITNAATLNAAGYIVAVQTATGASGPSAGVNGITTNRFATGACPTVAFNLPNAAPGTTVYVRARSESPGLTPSAWSSWASVALAAMPVPSALTFSPIYENAVQFNFTPANSTDPIDVFCWPTAIPAGPYLSFVATLPPGSTSCIVRNLNGPGVLYTGAVCHRDAPSGNDGTLVSGTFTTNSASIVTAPTPQGIEILPTTQDASLPTGIVLALYAADPVYDLVIQRAPDSSGSPGAWVTIAQVPGNAQIYVDYLPNDGAVRWYQIQHVLSGATSSAFVGPLSAVPGGVAPSASYVRPPFSLPQLQVVINQTASTATTVSFTVTILDPQGGGGTCTVTPSTQGLTSLIDQVTSAPAAPYTATIGVARAFVATLALPLAGGGFAQFSATETSRYTGTGTIFVGAQPQNAAPTMTIAIGNSQSVSVSTALVSAIISAPSNAASIKWIASTSAQPTAAAVIAGGAPVSAGAPVFAIADLGVALNLGDTVYLTAVYYDTGGTPWTSVQGVATRANIVATKTVQFPALGWLIATVGVLGTDFAAGATTGEITSLNTYPAAHNTAGFQTTFALPGGCTVIAFAMEIYQDTGGALNAESSLNIPGARVASLGSFAATGAWQTVSATCSQSTTGIQFTIVADLANTSATATGARMRSFTITYTSSNTQATL
jgi:hypothetical protein